VWEKHFQPGSGSQAPDLQETLVSATESW